MKKKFIGSLILLLSLVACNLDNTSGIPLAAASDSAVAIPTAVQRFISADPNDGVLNAYVSLIDSNETEEIFPMEIVGEQAQVNIRGVVPGTYTIIVEFEFITQAYGNRLLAGARKSVELGAVQTNLSFLSSEYFFPDDDNDGLENITEFEIGSNPTFPTDYGTDLEPDNNTFANAPTTNHNMVTFGTVNDLSDFDDLYALSVPAGGDFYRITLSSSAIDVIDLVLIDISGGEILSTIQGATLLLDGFIPEGIYFIEVQALATAGDTTTPYALSVE